MSDADRTRLLIRLARREVADDDGERTVALMRARLPAETEPAVLRWMVSALGYHRDRESLAQVAALAGHPDARVRFHVAAALPSLADPTTAEPETVDALLRLCRDGDADIRFYAVYAATREMAGLSLPTVDRLTARLLDDPDEQVSAMAAAHREAVRDLRRRLAGTVGECDHLIPPVLVTLACAGDAAVGLDDELRRRLGDTATSVLTRGVAEELVTWWSERESRTWS